jgi:hypothetical protein
MAVMDRAGIADAREALIWLREVMQRAFFVEVPPIEDPAPAPAVAEAPRSAPLAPVAAPPDPAALAATAEPPPGFIRRWLRIGRRRPAALLVPASVGQEEPAQPTVVAPRVEASAPALETSAQTVPVELTRSEPAPSEHVPGLHAPDPGWSRLEPWRRWPELVGLATAFELTDDECRVLLLAAAPELDSSFPSFCMALFGQASVPTFALADQLFPGSAAIVTAADRPLRHYLLLEVFQPGGTPLLQSEVHASEWVIERLRGGSALDDRLVGGAQRVPFHERDLLAPSHRPVADGLADLLAIGSTDGRPFAQLCGPAGGDKRAVASAAAGDVRMFRLRPDALSVAAGESDLLARLWEREDRFEPLVLFLDSDEVDDQPEQAMAVSLRRFVDRCAVPIVMSCREPWRSLDRLGQVFDLERPLPREQEAAWRHTLPAEAADVATELAGQYDLGLDEIRRLARDVGLPLRGQPLPDDLADRLWAACRSHKRPQLEGLAQRIEVTATLEDLVLPEPERALIDQLADQVRNRARVYHDWEISSRVRRGLGITAVFAGESGTGKTLAAEALASELRLDLYRIDLSAVVDKYVGETEKNLRRLFDGGEDGGVLLLFDEADALFGKRTEVKESHDRYANIEINYLLQRIETYRGLVVLATNAKASMDPAFLRRLRFIVTFPFPGAEERHRIWELTIPAARRGDDLDLDRLANLSLTGGHIRNIGLNALFLAAAAGADAVSMAHASQAAATEFRKIGRPWNDDVLATPVVAGVHAA